MTIPQLPSHNDQTLSDVHLNQFNGLSFIIFFCILFGFEITFKLEPGVFLRIFFLHFLAVKLITAHQCVWWVTSNLTNLLSWEDGSSRTCVDGACFLFPSPNLLTNEGSRDALWWTVLWSRLCYLQRSDLQESYEDLKSSRPESYAEETCLYCLRSFFTSTLQSGSEEVTLHLPP